jgi:hypothetical protein
MIYTGIYASACDVAVIARVAEVCVVADVVQDLGIPAIPARIIVIAGMPQEYCLKGTHLTSIQAASWRFSGASILSLSQECSDAGTGKCENSE